MNQYAKNKNARVAFTIADGYSVPVVFEFEGKNGTNSIDLTDLKGRIHYAIKTQNFKSSTCYKSACRLFILKKMDN